MLYICILKQRFTSKKAYHTGSTYRVSAYLGDRLLKYVIAYEFVYTSYMLYSIKDILTNFSKF